MEMRTSASSGAASETDRITCSDYLVRFDKCFVEMAVDSFKSVGMAKDNVVAITFAFISGKPAFPVKGGIYGVIAPDGEVDTLMHSSESLAIAIVGSDFPGYRHEITGHIDYFRVWHIGFLEWVDCLAVPSFCVDIGFRFKVIINKIDESVFFNESNLVFAFCLIREKLLVCIGMRRFAGYRLSGHATDSKG